MHPVCLLTSIIGSGNAAVKKYPQNLEDMLSGGYTIRRICNQEDMLTQIPKTICPYSAIPAHMRIPGTVAIQTATPAHFQLFVSLAIA